MCWADAPFASPAAARLLVYTACLDCPAQSRSASRRAGVAYVQLTRGLCTHSEEESSDEEEVATKKAAAAKKATPEPKKAAAKKDESSDEDSDSDEEDGKNQ